MDIFTLKLFAAGVILAIAVLAGWLPFRRKIMKPQHFEFPAGEALASGVFLGAGLIHMLPDATEGFSRQGFQYPLAALLVGISFLLFLLLEHIGQEIHARAGGTELSTRPHQFFALLATVMLSIHAFLEGTALGINNDYSFLIIIFLAIVAHKWAASFALAVQINKAMDFNGGIILYFIFCLIGPAGILFGNALSAPMDKYPIVQPIFTSLAAGTFLYLGTLHGLKRAVLIERCCNLRSFLWVILGFALMAVVALWT